MLIRACDVCGQPLSAGDVEALDETCNRCALHMTSIAEAIARDSIAKRKPAHEIVRDWAKVYGIVPDDGNSNG